MSQFSRLIAVVLSFAVLLLAGCHGGSDGTPTGTFTADQVSGKTFAYSSSTGPTGTLAFRIDILGNIIESGPIFPNLLFRTSLVSGGFQK